MMFWVARCCKDKQRSQTIGARPNEWTGDPHRLSQKRSSRNGYKRNIAVPSRREALKVVTPCAGQAWPQDSNQRVMLEKWRKAASQVKSSAISSQPPGLRCTIYGRSRPPSGCGDLCFTSACVPDPEIQGRPWNLQVIESLKSIWQASCNGRTVLMQKCFMHNVLIQC
jgi:hypothetical protein